MVAQIADYGGERPMNLRLVTEARGAVARLWTEAEGEVIIAGAAGTGKTRGILDWIHMRCSTGTVRVLMLRKRLEDLKASALVTYQEQVLFGFDGRVSAEDGVTYFGGNKLRPAEFVYGETGSKIVLGGMDRSSKVLSTEYDIIYVNEATELSLDEWEKITGRTDRPSMTKNRPPSLVIGDCNPDAPTHWIVKRANDGKLKLWASTHEDNPAMWDRVKKVWTDAGNRYLARLEKLTGHRYQRLRWGKWVAAEGLVYENYNAAVHLIKRPSSWENGLPPLTWTRFWIVDFGYTNPFVCQFWVVDPDGRLYRYREIYYTRRLVTEHADTIRRLVARDALPSKVICDHDAEDRATLEKALGIRTLGAVKDVSPGIQAVENRLAIADDGKPRLFLVEGALVEKDRALEEVGKPTCTEEEFTVYVWDESISRSNDEAVKQRKGEQPVKANDHGMDATRYMVFYLDNPKNRSKVIRGSY